MLTETAATINLSHLVIASSQVQRMVHFLEVIFGIVPHFANDEFADFVLSSGARIAIFQPVGKSANYFDTAGARRTIALGITVKNIGEFYENCLKHQVQYGLKVSGPPKEHPWGEPSFLLIDPDENRWEITQSPSASGMLVSR